MNNADPATTSNQKNDLMNTESTNNVEDNDPILKNTTLTILNPHVIITPPPK